MEANCGQTIGVMRGQQLLGSEIVARCLFDIRLSHLLDYLGSLDRRFGKPPNIVGDLHAIVALDVFFAGHEFQLCAHLTEDIAFENSPSVVVPSEDQQRALLEGARSLDHLQSRADIGDVQRAGQVETCACGRSARCSS